MMSNLIYDECTDEHCITIFRFPRDNEFVAEAFIKDKGFIWYAVLRYPNEPSLSKVILDTYQMKCRSPRPYRAGQACDGSITAPVFHLYDQVCCRFNIDPIALYLEAYDDHIFTRDQLDEVLTFAQWQGVEIVDDINTESIQKILESLHEVNMHQLANVLEEKIGM